MFLKKLANGSQVLIWVDLIWRIRFRNSSQLDEKGKKREIYPHEELVTFSWNVHSYRHCNKITRFERSYYKHLFVTLDCNKTVTIYSLLKTVDGRMETISTRQKSPSQIMQEVINIATLPDTRWWILCIIATTSKQYNNNCPCSLFLQYTTNVIIVAVS